jgi:sugar phosphate isomerase/epimerase
MKLAFSTQGCLKWDIDTIVAKAVEYNFNGVEIRGLLGEFNIQSLPEFSTRSKETAKKFQDRNITIPCFGSTVFLFTPFQGQKKPVEENLKEIEEYAKLCHMFDSKYIRVFGGRIGNQKREDAINEAISTLGKMGKIADEYGAMVLLETHDDWSKSEYIRSVMMKVKCDSVGVLWDILHPVLNEDESPVETWGNVGDWVYHTHLKDYFLDEGRQRICMVGDGVLPVREIVELLQRNGYDGFYCLEWPKKHYPELESAETVFPHFIEYMNKL